MRLFIPDANMRAVMVILCAVPVGNLAFMLARARGQRAEVLSNGVILTTLLSIVTIPIVCLFV
jgi:predicted permease